MRIKAIVLLVWLMAECAYRTCSNIFEWLLNSEWPLEFKREYIKYIIDKFYLDDVQLYKRSRLYAYDTMF